jgi:alpha-galactosidase
MNSKRIVLVGAGSAQFGIGTVADILTSEIFTEGTIILHDINEFKLEQIRTICQQAIDEKKAEFSLEATTTRSEALAKADYIVISIEVGDRFQLWEQDYKIPRKYGNKQIFGENGGPGGLFHSLRIIPPIIEICEDIEKLCPNAWVFNFSNPMSRICLAIKRRFKGRLKVVGLCHEIRFLEKHLPQILNIPFSKLDIKAGGLNHFGVLLEAKFKDTEKDVYPDIRQKAPNYLANVKEVGLIKEILRIYGYLPYTTDSHFGEYIHWAWMSANLKHIREFYEEYKAWCLNSFQELKKIIDAKKNTKMWLKPSVERLIPIIEGILSDSKHYELAVNVSNEKGVITNLPRDLIVECPAIVDKHGIHSMHLGEIPKGLAALMRTQASVQDLAVDAALTGSRELALQALLADPVVDNISSAENMLDEILNVQQEFLPIFKNKVS